MIACNICESITTRLIFEAKDIPRSGQFLSDPDQPYATTTLKWFGCETCGGISLKPSDGGAVDYTNVLRSTAGQLPRYQDQLIRLVSAAVQRNAAGSVIEIGSNDGTFLKLVKDHNVKNLFAIEPSLAFNSIYEKNLIPVANQHLTVETAIQTRDTVGAASVVVCRHTLEHVPEPLNFLKALRLLLADSNSIVLLEVPDTEILIKRALLHELWDEHLNYFSESNLRLLCHRTGFIVHEVRRYAHLDSGHILLVLGKASTLSSQFVVEPFATLNNLTTEFSELVLKLQSCGLQWPGRVVAMGASHPQTNYLSLSGAARYIDMIIDDDVAKKDLFVPLLGRSPVAIKSTQALLELSEHASVLLTAFGYPQWVERVKRESVGSRKWIEPYAPNIN